MALFAETVTLSANAVSTVTLTGTGWRVRVSSHASSGPVYFRADGVDPVLGADECRVVLPGCSRVIGLPRSGEVRLRHAGTPVVTVELEG
jgi:hypothetical protein